MERELNTKRIAVVGAGPVGYVTAILMNMRGYQVELFEKRDNPLLSSQSLEGRTSNFVIGFRAFEALRRIGVLEEV